MYSIPVGQIAGSITGEGMVAPVIMVIFFIVDDIFISMYYKSCYYISYIYYCYSMGFILH